MKDGCNNQAMYLPHDGEEGGRVDDEGAVEAAGVVVGDDLERAHQQVQESRRGPEKACEIIKRFGSSFIPSTTRVSSFPTLSCRFYSTALCFFFRRKLGKAAQSFSLRFQTAPAGKASQPKRPSTSPPKAAAMPKAQTHCSGNRARIVVRCRGNAMHRA